MISQCANSKCGRAFHYLRGGRLYRFDLRQPQEPCTDVPNAICAGRPEHASVYFWLCGECSRKYAVQFSSREGVRVLPLEHRPQRIGPVVVQVANAE